MIALVLVVLAIAGMPLFAVIAIAALLSYRDAELDPSLLAMEFAAIAQMPLLTALPLFIFSGLLICRSKTPQRLADLAGSLPGPAGLPVVFACALLTAFTGMAAATVAVLGVALLPTLARAGYRRHSGQEMIAASSGAGTLLVPSLFLIVYAAISHQISPRFGVDIHHLYLAAIVPALLILALLAARTAWIRPSGPSRRPDGPGLVAAMRCMALELPLPVLVLGGIYSGWLSVVAAALLTTTWLLITLIVIRADMALTALPGVIKDSMMLTASVFILLGMSLAAGSVMIDAGLAQRLIDLLARFVDSPLVLVLVIAMALIVAGLLLDALAALLVFMPLMFPVAMTLGIAPLHLGVVMLVSLQVGSMIRPLLLECLAADRRLRDQVLPGQAASLPTVALMLIVLLAIACWPQLSLWMPGRVGA